MFYNLEFKNASNTLKYIGNEHTNFAEKGMNKTLNKRKQRISKGHGMWTEIEILAYIGDRKSNFQREQR